MPETVLKVIHILLIDDHAMFREGVARMLDKEEDFKVVAQVTSATEGLAALKDDIDVVVLDVDLGPERAIEFIRGAHDSGFRGRILVVTAGVSDPEAVQLIQFGIAGILHKHHSIDMLCDRIRRVAAGEVCLEPKYLAPLFGSVDVTKSAKKVSLTDRDKFVMRGVLQGLSNRDIGTRINISEGAAKASLRHVCEKLGVHTRSQLVKVALEQYKDQL